MELTQRPELKQKVTLSPQVYQGLNILAMPLADLELLVEGTLTAQGAAGDTVVFTTDSNVPAWTDWQGIVVRGKAARIDLAAVIVQNANEGIKCLQGSVKLRDATVRRCYQYGIVLHGGRAELDNVFLTQVGNVGGTGMGVVVDRQGELEMRNSYVVGAQNGITFSAYK